MSTFKSTNRKKNFSNPFGSLADPSAHIQTNKQTNKQTDKITLLYRLCRIKYDIYAELKIISQF